MGTRNLTLVWYKGKWHIAQYGQWDGYPDGQGRTIVNFITNMNKDPEAAGDEVNRTEHQPKENEKDVIKDNIAALKAAIDREVLYIPTEDECTEWAEDCGKISREARQAIGEIPEDMGTYRKLLDATSRPMMLVQPSMARDLGGQILSVVANAKDKIPVRLDLDFIMDGLFCEWAYVVDLDESVLEVYCGTHESRSGPKALIDPGRFRDLLSKEAEEERTGDQRTEPRLVASYRFEELKQLGTDGFVAEMDALVNEENDGKGDEQDGDLSLPAGADSAA